MGKNLVRKFKVLEMGRDNQHKEVQAKYVKNKGEPKPKVLGPKYELTEWFKWSDGIKVWRIRALRDFDEVKAGYLGGYVESEANLSHDGDCWISQYAIVRDKALVCENAWALDYSIVRDEARICGSACVFDNVVLRGRCLIKGNVQLYKKVVVGGRVQLWGDLHFDDNRTLSAYLKTEFEKRKIKNEPEQTTEG
jgi:hypothetical protein